MENETEKVCCNITLDASLFQRLETSAKVHGYSVEEFCIKIIDFSLTHLFEAEQLPRIG